MPLGYFRDGDHIYCGCVDHTTKIRNIDKPKVSLVIESGSTMSDIKGAMIQGTAIVRRDPASVLEIMRKAAAAGRTSRPPTEPRPGSAYIDVAIERRISWDYGS